MTKTLLTFSAAILLAAGTAQAQSRHGNDRSVGDRTAFRHEGDFGRHGHGRYFYYGGVPYFYPYYDIGFGFPGYAYGYGLGFNEPYGDGAYEGRIVQDSGNQKGGTSLPAVVQRQLAEKGYYKGAIDGQFGPQSRDALSRFQSKNGLKDTGVIDEPSLMALGFSDRR